MLRAREQRFRDLGIESMRDFRQRKARLATMPPEEAARDPLSQDNFGDVVLVVDGWASIKSDFESLEPVLQSLAIQGLSYGVHLAISASPLDGDSPGGQGHARHPHRAAAGRSDRQ